MVELHGIERVGFLTLTFAEQIIDPKEAQKRWRSLRTNVLIPRYGRYLRVFERQHSGRIHYHVLVALPHDIRTGFDWEQAAKRVYSSANGHLRAEWAFWRSTAPAYRFGRTELLPVRSGGQAIGRYVGKYIGKHLEARLAVDKGVRLVEYSSGWKFSNSRFAWHSPGSWLWREKVKLFADSVGAPSLSHLRHFYGKRWAYFLRSTIEAMNITDYPTAAHAVADGKLTDSLVRQMVENQDFDPSQPLRIEPRGQEPRGSRAPAPSPPF